MLYEIVMSVNSWREDAIEKLKSEEFDLVVIGGGINGAGIARDAALRGLKVALIEKDDFAEGTSSRSSKLVHGGLRYLKYYEFKLVREATTERKTLMNIAGHNVHRLPFLVPIFKWSKEGKFLLMMGLTLYDILSLPKGIGWHKMLDREKIVEKEPVLETEELVSGAMYYDCQMDDARLCVENVVSAVRFGAVALNHCEAIDFLHDEDGNVNGVIAKEKFTGEKIEIHGKVVINTGGPWADKIRNLTGKNVKRLRTTKGVHLIVPKMLNDNAVILFLKDGRAVFLIPWHNYTMIGTTDTDYNDKPELVSVDAEDVRYLVENIKDAFPKFNIKYEDIISAYAGLRPLVRQEGKSESEVSREHRIFEDEDGLITLIGGKYTTYRTMAKELVDLAVKRLGYKGKRYQCITDKVPLVGGNFENLDELKQKIKERSGLEDKYVEHLANSYGAEALKLILYAKAKDLSLEPIDIDFPFLWAEIDWTIREEFACKLKDFMWRRTYFALTPGQGIQVADKIAKRMAEVLGWDDERIKKEIEEYKQTLELVNKWKKEMDI